MILDMRLCADREAWKLVALIVYSGTLCASTRATLRCVHPSYRLQGLLTTCGQVRGHLQVASWPCAPYNSHLAALGVPHPIVCLEPPARLRTQHHTARCAMRSRTIAAHTHCLISRRDLHGALSKSPPPSAYDVCMRPGALDPVPLLSVSAHTPPHATPSGTTGPSSRTRTILPVPGRSLVGFCSPSPVFCSSALLFFCPSPALLLLFCSALRCYQHDSVWDLSTSTPDLQTSRPPDLRAPPLNAGARMECPDRDHMSCPPAPDANRAPGCAPRAPRPRLEARARNKDRPASSRSQDTCTRGPVLG